MPRFTPEDILRAGWLLDPAGFARKVSRGKFLIPKWIDYVSRIIAEETANGNARLLISVPPQHGKSFLVSGYYPLWRMEMDPSRRVGVVSYSATLAVRAVRHGRDLVRDRQDILRIRMGKSAEDYWETTDGSPPGYVRGMGIMGSITGFGFTDLVIDDPYANAEEAFSETIRAKVREAYWSTLSTRLAEGGNIIGIATRWHSQDLFGELAATGRFRVIRLPALAEEDDPLGRAPGEPLWPELHSLASLEEKRATYPPATWAALYQGRPITESGGIFKRAWFRVIDAPPALVSSRVRYWDPAASRAQRAGDPDFAVGTLASKVRDDAALDGAYCIEEVDRDRGTALDLERRIVSAAHRDGKRVPIRIEEEPGSQGASYVAHLTRLLSGWDVKGIKHGAGADKLSRARPFAAQMEVGNVVWVRGPWLEQAMREFEVFVGDGSEDHDDVVDSATGAFEALCGTARFPWESLRPTAIATPTGSPSERARVASRSPLGREAFDRAAFTRAIGAASRGGRGDYR